MWAVVDIALHLVVDIAIVAALAPAAVAGGIGR